MISAANTFRGGADRAVLLLPRRSHVASRGDSFAFSCRVFNILFGGNRLHSLSVCCRPAFLIYYSGETGYTHSLSPSRPPNNTLNTRQQRTQVQGHISHTRARADRRVPRMLRIRSGRGRHSVRTVLPQIEAAELHEREEPRLVVHVV